MTNVETTSARRNFWLSQRGRRLVTVAFVVAVFVVATIAVVSRDQTHTAQQFSPAKLFPKFADAQERATSVTVASKESSVTITKAEGGRWVVREAHDYRASQDRVRKLFLGLADLQAIERKTARPDWQAELGLVAAADGGPATTITVADKDGKALAAVLVGRLQPGRRGGPMAAFVRVVGTTQAYLAEGDLPLDSAAKEWVDPGIVDLPRERVRRVAVTPASGPAYAVARAKPEDINFVLEAVPSGREMMGEVAANGLGAGAISVNLEEVRPVSEIDFTGAARTVYETFDGLSVILDVVKHGETSWLRVNALAAPVPTPSEKKAAPDPAAEAAAINERTKGWAYAIADWKASLFTKPLEALLKTPAPSPARHK